MKIPKIFLGPITGFLLGIMGTASVAISTNKIHDYITVWMPFIIIDIIVICYYFYEKLKTNQ